MSILLAYLNVLNFKFDFDTPYEIPDYVFIGLTALPFMILIAKSEDSEHSDKFLKIASSLFVMRSVISITDENHKTMLYDYVMSLAVPSMLVLRYYGYVNDVVMVSYIAIMSIVVNSKVKLSHITTDLFLSLLTFYYYK